MDFLLELLLGFFLEAPMGSRRVKTWVKTVLMTVLCSLAAGLLVFCTYVMIVGRRPFAAFFMGTITLWWIWISVKGNIDGHKRGWKQDW